MKKILLGIATAVFAVCVGFGLSHSVDADAAAAGDIAPATALMDTEVDSAAVGVCQSAAAPASIEVADADLQSCSGSCTSDSWCRKCTGIPYAMCLGGHCAF